MNYDWSKIIAPGEEIQKEFTISKRYIQIVTFLICVLGIAAFFVSIYVGVIIIILGGVYFLYLSRAKHYCFTSKRIILVDSFIGTDITSIDYNQVTDVEIEQSFADQIGGWGSLIINTAGTHVPEIRLTFIEDPQAVKKKMDEVRDSGKKQTRT